MGKDIKYIQTGIEAEYHSAIYKMHKYFARRPHNVFKHLIENYTVEGDTILDPFCGGGVTLIEGLALNRKVIGVDTNPLATFITDVETTIVDIDKYKKLMAEIRDYIQTFATNFYTTECRSCHQSAPVRWYELAYTVICPHGKHETLASNLNKLIIDGKPKPGSYECQVCSKAYKSVDAKKSGYKLLKVIYKCSCQKERQSFEVNADDVQLMSEFESSFPKQILTYDLWYPTDNIPDVWDRQQEDCLHRKSINNFSDFFTKRSLFFNALLLKKVQSYKNDVDKDLYNSLLFTFSAVLRYTNNMTYSADNWMGGRPIAWDKHAYWLPNQFVEVNPIEYIDKRITAITLGLAYQAKYYPRARNATSSAELVDKSADKLIINSSANDIKVKSSTVNAVITDPPYGSNVQYGELCHYWLVWLQKDLDLDNKLFNLKDEILVQRKAKTKNRKGYEEYYQGLKGVYSESYRVLKAGGVLTFTFNNKDIRAWYAVMKACIVSGFHLEPEGIFFQDSVQNYKNTAHYRFSGTVHGDFIYTFIKDTGSGAKTSPAREKELIQADIKQVILDVAANHKVSTPTELFTIVIPELIPFITELALKDVPIDEINEYINLKHIEAKYLVK